jgi:hypothetical protein
VGSKRPTIQVTRPTGDQDTSPAPFPFSTAVAPHSIQLPPEANELDDPERELARSFLTAWRRTGEFLLEAARWMSEARARVEHGRWGLWLRVVGVSDDLSENLRNLHARANQLPRYAEAVRTGQLGATSAYLLAPASVPDELVMEVLEAPAPIPTKMLERRLRDYRRHRRAGGEMTPAELAAALEHDASQIPRYAESTPRAAPDTGQIPRYAESDPRAALDAAPLGEALRGVVREMTATVRGLSQTPQLLTPEDWAALAELAQALRELQGQAPAGR